MAVSLNGLRAKGRTLRRAAQIAEILYRNGFEAFVDRTPLAPLVSRRCRAEVKAACRCAEGRGTCPCAHALPLPQRILATVVALGPTAIKLGQVASTRPDLVPPHFSEPLRALQEKVPSVPFEAVRSTVEAELDRPLAQAFRTFDETPVAAASLAQVHFATLPDGTPVAVKVQRPGIRDVIEQDLAILGWLARQAARLYPRLRNLHPEEAVAEFGRWTLRELDFRLEGQNLDEFRRNFAGQDDVVFPRVYWDQTTPRVLTMEQVAGLRVHAVTPALSAMERERLARRLAEIELQMFITDAFFHADLHPGNIFFDPDGRIVILDVGMVGRMAPENQDRFLCYWVAITRRQRARAFHHLRQMALPSPGADWTGFRRRYEAILDRFYDAPLSERSLAQTYLDILLAGAEVSVSFPSEMILQAKAVVTAEALDLVLYPDFQFTEEARPIVAREVAKRASPRYLVDRLWSGLAEFVLLGEVPPAGPAANGDLPDERRFRQEVVRALAHSWAEDADARLRDGQTDTDRYTSPTFWQEHPKGHALLQTGLGLLRLVAMQLERGRQVVELDGSATNGTGSRNGRVSVGIDDGGWERYQAFLADLDTGESTGRSFSAEMVEMVTHWEEQARRFPEADFWLDKQMLRAGLKSGLGLLRLLVGQAAQAIAEEQDGQTGEGEEP